MARKKFILNPVTGRFNIYETSAEDVASLENDLGLVEGKVNDLGKDLSNLEGDVYVLSQGQIVDIDRWGVREGAEIQYTLTREEYAKIEGKEKFLATLDNPTVGSEGASESTVSAGDEALCVRLMRKNAYVWTELPVMLEEGERATWKDVRGKRCLLRILLGEDVQNAYLIGIERNDGTATGVMFPANAYVVENLTEEMTIDGTSTDYTYIRAVEGGSLVLGTASEDTRLTIGTEMKVEVYDPAQGIRYTIGDGETADAVYSAEEGKWVVRRQDVQGENECDIVYRAHYTEAERAEEEPSYGAVLRTIVLTDEHPEAEITLGDDYGTRIRGKLYDVIDNTITEQATLSIRIETAKNTVGYYTRQKSVFYISPEGTNDRESGVAFKLHGGEHADRIVHWKNGYKKGETVKVWFEDGDTYELNADGELPRIKDQHLKGDILEYDVVRELARLKFLDEVRVLIAGVERVAIGQWGAEVYEYLKFFHRYWHLKDGDGRYVLFSNEETMKLFLEGLEVLTATKTATLMQQNREVSLPLWEPVTLADGDEIPDDVRCAPTDAVLRAMYTPGYPRMEYAVTASGERVIFDTLGYESSGNIRWYRNAYDTVIGEKTAWVADNAHFRYGRVSDTERGTYVERNTVVGGGEDADKLGEFVTLNCGERKIVVAGIGEYMDAGAWNDEKEYDQPTQGEYNTQNWYVLFRDPLRRVMMARRGDWKDAWSDEYLGAIVYFFGGRGVGKTATPNEATIGVGDKFYVFKPMKVYNDADFNGDARFRQLRVYEGKIGVIDTLTGATTYVSVKDMASTVDGHGDQLVAQAAKVAALQTENARLKAELARAQRGEGVFVECNADRIINCSTTDGEPYNVWIRETGKSAVETSIGSDTDYTLPEGYEAIVFQNATTLKYINKFPDTSGCKNLSFSGCTNLRNVPRLDLTAWESASSQDASVGLFQNCKSLREVPVLDFTGKASVRNAFLSCFRLEVIHGMKTTGVSDFTNAFAYCGHLTAIPDGFDTSSGTTMTGFVRLDRAADDLDDLGEIDFGQCVEARYWHGYVGTSSFYINPSYFVIKNVGGQETQYFSSTKNSFVLNKTSKAGLSSAEYGTKAYWVNFLALLYDRVGAGYTSAFTLTLPTAVKNALSEAQLAEIAAKGFTIA